MTTPQKKKIKLSKRLLLKYAPFCIAKMLRGIFLLNRTSLEGEERLKTLLNSGDPLLVAIWHENASTLLPILPRFVTKDLCVLASKSKDGELAARMVKHFGIDCVRGSSSRGGSEALNELIKAIPNVKALGLTVDGPRGPRRKSKPGIALLSHRTGYPIFMIASSATRHIRVNSWDRTIIPLPFGRYVYKVGEMIQPPKSGSREDINAKILELDIALNDLQESLEKQYGIDPQLAPESDDT